jgi:hypothetical protein
VEVINSSTCPLISKLLRDPDEAAAAASAGKAKKKATTLGFQFKSSLEGLMTSLYRCEPHFVRCMKSNHQKKGNVFESDMMMAQLRYAGLLEVCRIRKIGFPVRKKFDEFIFRYRCLDLSSSKDHVKLCKALEEKKLLKPRQWVIGHSKVFMRNLQQQELEEAREASLVHVVMKMQAVAKRFIYYTRYKKFIRILRTIRDAIATRTEEALDAALSEAPELPWGGAHVGVVKEARALKERLEDERRVTGLCTEAIKARDLAELRSACKAAEDIAFDSPVVRDAVKLRDLMERERAAVKALKAATEARSLDQIVAALTAAGESPGPPGRRACAPAAAHLPGTAPFRCPRVCVCVPPSPSTPPPPFPAHRRPVRQVRDRHGRVPVGGDAAGAHPGGECGARRAGEGHEGARPARPDHRPGQGARAVPAGGRGDGGGETERGAGGAEARRGGAGRGHEGAHT